MDDRVDPMQVRTRWVSRLVVGALTLGVVASPVARAAATPMFPWQQDGDNAAHTWSNGGPSPSTDVPLWTSKTGEDLGGVGAVAHGLVFVQQADGVVALNEKTGALVKTYRVADPRNFAVVGDRLVVGDEAGSVRAFNVSTGALLWTTATGPINNIVVAGGRVFTDTGLGDGQLRALNLKTGKILWDVGGIAGSSSPPTVAGDVVYQNSDGNGKVLAFNAATGAPVWSSTVGAGASSVVAGKSLLFFGTQGGDLLALNRKTGATVWDTTLGGEIYATGTSRGLAFASSFSGIVYALNAKTGKIDWSFNTGSGFQSSPLTSADGRVFVSSQGSDPTLYAFNKFTGALLWSLPGATAPIVADGLVFASDPGEVIAIGATPEPSTLLLLGSSFVGLGGVALRRHRRAIGRRVVRAKSHVGS